MKRRLPALKPSAVLRALKRGGFVIHHVSGSHYILKHPEKPKLRITLAYHNRDLKRRTLDSVLEQAGLSQEEFIDLL